MERLIEIVNAATEAATLSALRALRSGAMGISHNAPASHDSPGSDNNQSETSALQHFERTCPRFALRRLTSFQRHQGKRGFRVLTRTSSWMCVVFIPG